MLLCMLQEALNTYASMSDYDLDPEVANISFDNDTRTLNIDWIPMLHRLPQGIQIEFVCNSYDLDPNNFSFSFDSQGFMTIHAKKSLPYMNCTMLIGKDGVSFE